MTASSYGLRGFDVWPQYKEADDNELLQRMGDTYNLSQTVQQPWWNTASVDERFYAGDQSLWNEIYANIPLVRRKQISFNKTARIINMVSGYQRRNRKSITFVPMEGADEGTADQFSKIMVWANNRIQALETVSDAFLGSLISGINLLSIWMDYRNDPLSGDVCVDNLGYNGFLIDPYFTKTDLSDCNYLWIRRFFSKKQIISMFPERKEEIELMSPNFSRDSRFNFMPENFNYVNKHLLSYDEYWYMDLRKADIIIDTDTGETLEYTGKEENLKVFLKLNPNLRRKKITKKTWKLGIVVNGRTILYHGKNPYKIDRLPFVPVTCYHRPELPYYEWRIQGMVRGMRDAQFLMNRRSQILLDILESQVNSGLKVMEGSLVDDNDAFKTGQGQVYFIKKDAPQGMASVEKIPAADIPQSTFNVIEMLDKNMMDTSGVNEELLGSAEDDKAGILSMLRQGAGLTTLQIPFDKLDAAFKEMGKIEMELVQKNFTPGKVQRILNQEPSEEFYQHSFSKYDCNVVESLDAPNQKMIAFKQALYLKELGLPITTKFLMEMSSFQNKPEQIKEMLEQEQQQQQMAQQQQQMEMMELQQRAKSLDAKAFADKGLGVERLSRVGENEGLEISRRSQAALDEVRAVKELQGMDIEQLRNLVDVLEVIKSRQDVEKEKLSPLSGGGQKPQKAKATKPKRSKSTLQKLEASAT